MRLVLAFLLALFVTAPAHAERRALLIANSAYQHLAPLQTPKANVEALAATLSKAHFQTQVFYDLSQADMPQKVRKFIETVQAGDFVLIYFSGYGYQYQVDKLNYLLPVSFDPRYRSPIGMKAVSVRNLQNLLDQRKAGTRMLLLDACRRATGLPQGLLPMDPASNTLVAFSAAANHSAPDPENGGPNPFTAALVNAIESPGSTPLSVLVRVQAEVARVSPGQVPFVTRASVGDFVFTERPAALISLSSGPAGEVKVSPMDGTEVTGAKAPPNPAPSTTAPMWPMEGGNERRSGYAPYRGPGRPRIAWSVEIRQSTSNGPLVGPDGRVYVWNGNVPDSLVRCVEDGRIVWSVPIMARHEAEWVRFGPDGSVEVYSSRGRVRTLNRDGTVARESTSSERWFGFYKWDGHVYHSNRYSAPGSSSTVWMFLRADDPSWQVELDGPGVGPVVDDRGLMYIGTLKGTLYAVDEAASILWKFSGGGWTFGLAVTPERDLLYANAEGLFCVRDAQLRWKFKPDGPGYSPPPIYDQTGTIFFGKGQNFYAIDQTGKELWRIRLADYISAPVAMDRSGRIYVPTNSRLYCISDADEPTAELAPPAASKAGAAEPPVVSVETIPKVPSSFPKAGDVKVNPKDNLRYVWIPPGTFQMGCSPADSECNDDEKPAHQVTISSGFWVGQTEVTQEAYQRVMGGNPSIFKGPKLPVANITWDDARSYCQAAGMRLPTEAEWEYAARAGRPESRYGDIDRIAWYSGNTWYSGNRGGGTHEVGQKEPNAWRLHDMLGNVWEWVGDWYAEYTLAAATDPHGPSSGALRVLRGGSWAEVVSGLARASDRNLVVPASSGDSIGVRCAGNVESLATAPLATTEGTGHPSPPKEKTIAPATDSPSTRTAEATKVNDKDELTYVWIPPGTFQMGCSPADSECSDRERPAHQVTISKGFWIGQTEVTQEAWQRVMGTDRSSFKGRKLPVETITWDDARSYCQTAGMRLPTEAEWEYAARADRSGSRYGVIDEIAWYSSNSGGTTHEVGQKQANTWGLRDMFGNVDEWVMDWYAEYPPGTATDPHGPSNGTSRVLRGGAWNFDSRNARASDRYGGIPAMRSHSAGVRCAGNAESLANAQPATIEGARHPSPPEEKASAPPTASPPVLRAGATKRNEKDRLTYVWIPPGTFQMGCSPGDGECYPDERPVHQVTISKGFWIGQTEVTQEAYERVAGNNPSHFKGPKLPVENIAWNDARSYCQAPGMRLPTDSEWEYAARAGSSGSRYDSLDAVAWHSGNSGTNTHDVAGKQPNAWGLYDMLGSVDEWVADWYSDRYSPGSATDPQGRANGTFRVLRGGAWGSLPRQVRASFRLKGSPAYHDKAIGVRCAGN